MPAAVISSTCRDGYEAWKFILVGGAIYIPAGKSNLGFLQFR